jgi:integrase/recombinase XerD
VKIDRHGQAKVLTQEEIQRLFAKGLVLTRDRTLCALMLYTACRVNEVVTLKTLDVYDRRGEVRPELIIRKGNTKGKLATRTVPVLDDLRRFLNQYEPSSRCEFLFPGRHGRGHLNSDSASWIIREACRRVGIEGASTHSFRRTALTQMSNAGIPLRVIQEISGHRNLDQLQRYLEVEPSQVRGAVAALSMLTPVVEEDAHIGKVEYNEVSHRQDSPHPKAQKREE